MKQITVFCAKRRSILLGLVGISRRDGRPRRPEDFVKLDRVGVDCASSVTQVVERG